MYTYFAFDIKCNFLVILLCRGDKTHRASVVLVGFSNGHLYGYSMSGQTVFMKQIHEDVINQVTFMSPPFSRRYESLVSQLVDTTLIVL